MPELVKELTRHMIACVALGVVPAVHFLLAASEKEMGHAKQVGSSTAAQWMSRAVSGGGLDS